MVTARRRRKPGVQKYKADVVRRAFAPWFVSNESATGEQPMYCPLCEDRDTSVSASASMNPEKGKWWCQKSDHGGSVYDLVQTLKREQGFQIRGAASRSGTKPAVKPLLPEPLDDQDRPQIDWPDALELSYPERVRYLEEVRGLNAETRQRFKVGFDGERFTVPIRTGQAGAVRNVRRYRPNARAKWINLDGHGSPSMLAFTGVLAGNALPVILAAGEWDAMLTNQEGTGRLVAVTGTGGETTPPPDLSALVSREVFVAYDCDEAGRKGAEKVTALLRKQGGIAHVLDLTRLGLPFTENHGADLTDFFMRYGGTVDGLLAEMERLRGEPADGPDEIDRAMEAAFLELSTPRREYTASLLSEDDILERPAIEYAVEPFVPIGMLTDAFGQPGSFKTYVGQDISNSIRSGQDWHGHPVKRGAVLLLEAEGVQQLQARIVAWNEHHDNPPMAAFRALDTPLDLSTPEGAAALVRTVRGMEAATGERVVLVWVDPAALYMSGSENDDGNRNLALGLNAVAKYLDIAVLLIVHTNASGERARGTDHFRMLSGSHIKVERLEDGLVGVVQEKVKNAAPRAVILRPVEVGRGLAFDTEDAMTAFEYLSRKDRSAWTAKTSLKLSEARAAREVKNTHAEALILAALADNPRRSTSQIRTATKNHGVGTDGIGQALAALVESGQVVAEAGARNATLYSLADGAE